MHRPIYITIKTISGYKDHYRRVCTEGHEFLLNLMRLICDF